MILRVGDEWPPVQFVDRNGPIDLTTANRVVQYTARVHRDESGAVVHVDSAVQHAGRVVDAARGLVAPPNLGPGEYHWENEIRWAAGTVEIIPNVGPQSVHVRAPRGGS